MFALQQMQIALMTVEATRNAFDSAIVTLNRVLKFVLATLVALMDALVRMRPYIAILVFLVMKKNIVFAVIWKNRILMYAWTIALPSTKQLVTMNASDVSIIKPG